MKLIDHSLYQSRDGKIGFWNRLQGTLQYGPSWYRDMQAQQAIIEEFRRVLDNRYVMLRNVILPGPGVPIPLILVGPTGIKVMLVSSARGVYRAKGGEWLVMDGGRFKAAKPNLVTRLQLMTRVLDAHLRRNGVTPPEIQPIILFTNPGMHVDTVNPAVRVVLSDAMERFVMGVAQDSGAFRTTSVDAVVKSLVPEEQPAVDQPIASLSEEDEDDFFSMRENVEDGSRGSAAIPGVSAVDSLVGKIRFSTGQWVALGLIIGLWVLLLMGFAVMILFF